MFRGKSNHYCSGCNHDFRPLAERIKHEGECTRVFKSNPSSPATSSSQQPGNIAASHPTQNRSTQESLGRGTNTPSHQTMQMGAQFLNYPDIRQQRRQPDKQQGSMRDWDTMLHGGTRQCDVCHEKFGSLEAYNRHLYACDRGIDANNPYGTQPTMTQTSSSNEKTKQSYFATGGNMGSPQQIADLQQRRVGGAYDGMQSV